jgi:TPR repeat protein
MSGGFFAKAPKIDEVLDDWATPHNTAELCARERDLTRLKEACALWDTEPELAFETLLRCAEEGSVYGMIQVAHAYAKGRGTEADEAKAEVWFTKAQSLGSGWAMLMLARQLKWQGRFVEAEAVLREAAQADYAPALYLLGTIYAKTERRREAQNALKRAAQLGHEWALTVLMRYSVRGYFGVFARLSSVFLAASFIPRIMRKLDQKA